MALIASEIKEYMNTHTLLSENISRMLLDLEDLLVYEVDYGTRDPDKPIYIYCTPNNRVIYPDTSGQPVCPHCGSLLSHIQQYEDRSIDDTPREHRRTVLEILYATRLCLDCRRTYSPRLLCAKQKARCTNRHNAAIVEEAFNKKSFKQIGRASCRERV